MANILKHLFIAAALVVALAVALPIQEEAKRPNFRLGQRKPTSIESFEPSGSPVSPLPLIQGQRRSSRSHPILDHTKHASDHVLEPGQYRERPGPVFGANLMSEPRGRVGLDPDAGTTSRPTKKARIGSPAAGNPRIKSFRSSGTPVSAQQRSTPGINPILDHTQRMTTTPRTTTEEARIGNPAARNPTIKSFQSSGSLVPALSLGQRQRSGSGKYPTPDHTHSVPLRVTEIGQARDRPEAASSDTPPTTINSDAWMAKYFDFSP